ncbi:MAG: restriction endonuclease subunit S [Eubacterium sp.]
MAKLKEVCTFFADGDWIESSDQSDEGIRLIQTGNIGEGKYLEKETRAKYISESTFNKLSCTEVYPGDILVSRLPEPVGRACIIPEKNERMITAVDCTICRPNETLISKEYMCYFMRSNVYHTRLLGSVTGTTRKRISRKNLGNVEVKIPPKGEQNAIVKQLDCLTSVISLRSRELELLDELVRGRFVELFGDPVINPMAWEKRLLKDVCTKLNDGTHFSPESFETGKYKYVTAKNIKASGFDFTNITYVPEEVHRAIYERCNPELGDVLYIKDGATTGIAMVNTLEEEFTLLSSVALLKQNRAIMNGHFLTTLLNNENMYMDIRNNMGGAAITRLTVAKLNAIRVIVPPIELQNEFADFVHQIDKSKFRGFSMLTTMKSAYEQQTLIYP